MFVLHSWQPLNLSSQIINHLQQRQRSSFTFETTLCCNETAQSNSLYKPMHSLAC